MLPRILRLFRLDNGYALHRWYYMFTKFFSLSSWTHNYTDFLSLLVIFGGAKWPCSGPWKMMYVTSLQTPQHQHYWLSLSFLSSRCQFSEQSEEPCVVHGQLWTQTTAYSSASSLSLCIGQKGAQEINFIGVTHWGLGVIGYCSWSTLWNINLYIDMRLNQKTTTRAVKKKN